MIGNSIPQCLLERVLHRMLTSLGYKLGKDGWENAGGFNGHHMSGFNPQAQHNHHNQKLSVLRKVMP